MSKLIEWIEKNTRPQLTLSELAQQMQVSLSTVSLWREGKRKPGRRVLKRLSELTGIKVEDLL